MLPWVIGAGALLGGIAGLQGSKGQSTTSSATAAPESDLEKRAAAAQLKGFDQLEDIQRIQGRAASNASTAYGNLLQQYSQSGGLPTQQDITQGQSFAQQMTAPQQAQIDLAMRQSTEAARQQAGLSGRGPTDFAMNTRLSGQRADLMNQLGAQQTAMGTQYAQQLSQNRLGFAGQFSDLQQGLATQAMQNRMAIMGLGSQIQQAGQNFRSNTATRTTSTPGQQGSLLSGITGAFTGATGGYALANAFGAVGGTGGSTGVQLLV